LSASEQCERAADPFFVRSQPEKELTVLGLWLALWLPRGAGWRTQMELTIGGEMPIAWS